MREEYKTKQIYMITYPTGKIYVGKDVYGSYQYYGSPNSDKLYEEFQKLPENVRKDYYIRKTILWESKTASEEELSERERYYIEKYNSNDPKVGYNRWPTFIGTSE